MKDGDVIKLGFGSIRSASLARKRAAAVSLDAKRGVKVKLDPAVKKKELMARFKAREQEFGVSLSG